MAEFAYNNVKNASISYIFFELNCGHYFYILYKENINFCSKSKAVDKLVEQLGNLIETS